MVVLGIRSVEGDDEFARNLTGALRHAASQVQGWTVSDREVTLAQAALAHGCEEPDPTCLHQMAGSLRTQRIVYGDVRRTSAGGSYDWAVNLHVFNAETDRIEHSVAEVVPGVRRDIDDLREPVRRFVSRLSGAPQVGTLRVVVNVPGAEVHIDDESVGVTDGRGQLVVPDVRSGSRNVRVTASNYQSMRSTVSVDAYGEATFEAELQASASGGGGGEPSVELLTGIGLLVAAAGLAAAWIGSWAHVRFGLENDPLYTAYRQGVTDYLRLTQGPGVDVSQVDVCAVGTLGGMDNWNLTHETMTYARGGGTRARQVCGEAATFEVLQFVFGIGAAAAAGAGLYFLITALTGDSTPPERQSVRLTPSVSPEHGYLGVQLSF